MGEFKVHHCRFFHYTPKPIQCLSYEESSSKLAVCRYTSDSANIEIWNVSADWFLEQRLLPLSSIEAVVWCGANRLFSAGLHGNIYEHCLQSGSTKATASSYHGSIWCLALNKSRSHIAAGTEDGCVVLFAVLSDGIQYERSLSKQDGRILTLGWCEGDSLVVTGGLENIRVWSIHSGHALQRLTLGRANQNVNEETVVWSLIVLSDFTIVSGDSRGRVCFWNGRTGTLVKSFKSHEADVYTLCTSADEHTVYAGGADARVVLFNLATCLGPNSDWPVWVSGTVKVNHSHDVKAMCYIKRDRQDQLVSAGLDSQLVVTDIKSKSKHHSSSRFLSPVSHTEKLVHVVEDMVMLQYDNRLELWRLGESKENSDIRGDKLQLSSSAVKLLELNVKNSEPKYQITCSTISQTLNFIAYSDSESVHIYSLNYKKTQELNVGPSCAISRLKQLPVELQVSVHCLAIVSDGETLISAPRVNQRTDCISCIQLFSLSTPDCPKLIKRIVLPSAPMRHVEPQCPLSSSIHILRVDRQGRYLAVGRLDKTLHVIRLQRQPAYVASIPSCGHQVAAIDFSPTSETLIAAYSDGRIIECNMHVYKKCSEVNVEDGARELCEYSDWTRKYGNDKMSSKQGTAERKERIVNIFYHPTRHQELFLFSDHQSITVVDKLKPISNETASQSTGKRSHDGTTKSPGGSTHGFRTSVKFKHIVWCEIMRSGSLLVVERTPASLADALPPSFRTVKKFGI